MIPLLSCLSYFYLLPVHLDVTNIFKTCSAKLVLDYYSVFFSSYSVLSFVSAIRGTKPFCWSEKEIWWLNRESSERAREWGVVQEGMEGKPSAGSVVSFICGIFIFLPAFLLCWACFFSVYSQPDAIYSLLIWTATPFRYSPHFSPGPWRLSQWLENHRCILGRWAWLYRWAKWVTWHLWSPNRVA